MYSLKSKSRGFKRGLVPLLGCGFLFLILSGAGVLPAAAEPVFKVGTVNLSLVCFFHPRMREYDQYSSRFLKYDEEIASLPPAERMKARRERALKRAEEMKSGEFKEELKRLQEVLTEKEKEIQEARTRMENLMSGYRYRIEAETRGLTEDDPVRQGIIDREKKSFEKQQEELCQTIETLLLDKEMLEEGVREKRFMAAAPAAYTDFMETDRIYWGIRADIRKTLEALCKEKEITVLLNTSYLLQDFIPFSPWEKEDMAFPDAGAWKTMIEKLCLNRNRLTDDFPDAVDTLILPADDRLAVLDITAEAVEHLLTLYGAGPTEKQVIKEMIEERLK